MRPTTTRSSTTRAVHLWKSPLPYLFGCLAVILILISVALIVLACSYRKSRYGNNSSSDGDEEKPQKPHINITAFDDEPKIVVIMAGEDKPTHLATPVITTSVCSCSCTCEKV